MTAPDTDSAAADFIRYAGLCAVLFLAPMACVVFWSVGDRNGNAAAERFVKVSAVGDEPTFQKPAGLDPSVPLASFEGVPLYPGEDPEMGIRDSRMRRAGVEDRIGAVVYRCTDPEQGDSFFLKTGVNRYVRLTRTPPEKK